MGKVIVLLLIILLAIVSLAGYLFLNAAISGGDIKIADGQRQIEKAHSDLKQGKKELSTGRQDLAEGKKEYEQAKYNLLLVIMDTFLNRGKGFNEARRLIREGNEQITQGKNEISVGEMRTEVGELELRRGKEQLILARRIRIAMALGAVFFTSLSIVLGFRWRRSLPLIKSLLVLKSHKN